jgi:hypothetical protein
VTDSSSQPDRHRDRGGRHRGDRLGSSSESDPGHLSLDQLIDRAMDAYALWREECKLARASYARSSRASGREADRWFESYLAALDREESAAGLYQDTLRLYQEALSRSGHRE